MAKILVVEDEMHMRIGLKDNLEYESFEVDLAEDGQKGLDLLDRNTYDLILLDELNIALKYDYIELDRVLDDLQARPEMQHVVVTGRGAPQELIDLADTVTEMGVVKHAFKDQGIKAQKGVEL